MNAPRWIREDALRNAHQKQLAIHGGADGVRDINLLRSALARPQSLYAYGEPAPDLAALAAAYAFGLAKNHPFMDGNKRVSLLAADGFLQINGWQINASQTEVYDAFYTTAAGSTSEEEIAQWIRGHLVPLVEEL